MDKFLNASRFFVLLPVVFLFMSCGKKEPCLDVNAHKSWIEITKQWQDTTAETKRVFVDSWGIDEMLIISNPYVWEVPGSVYDGCDKPFDSYQFSAIYTTALSNYRFEVKFSVQPQALFRDFSLSEEQYVTLEIEYQHRSAQSRGVHSLILNGSITSHGDTYIHQQQTINNVEYAEVLEINFQTCGHPSALSQINYAKGAGIVSFTTCGGNTFVLK